MKAPLVPHLRVNSAIPIAKAAWALCVVAMLCGVGLAQKTALSVESLIRQGKFREAQSRLETLANSSPRDPHLMFLLGDLQQREGKYFAAEKAWRAALEADPKSGETLANLAELYSDEERVSEAVPLLERLLAIKLSSRAKTQLAEAYTKSGEFEKSLAIATSVPVASRPDKLLPIMVADYIGLKRNEDMQKTVPEILKRAPANPEIVAQLANVFLVANMVGDASELLKLAQSHLKPTASLLTAMANVQARSGQEEQAKATLKRALQLDPKLPDALWGAARVAGHEGDWKQAVGLLKQMTKVAPPRPEVSQNLVYAALQIDDLQTAHDAALDLHDLQPDSLDSVMVMSAVLIRASAWGEAEPSLRKALAKYPEDKRLLLAIGIVDYNLGHLDQAENELRSSLGQQAGDAEAHYMLGLVAKQRGDITGAAEQMEASLKSDAKKPETLSSLGQLYLQLNEVDKAKDILERAVGAVPENAQNHYQLAITYRRLGMSAEAKAQMELFQKLSARHVVQPTGDAATSR